jgi:hypothetical protein
VRSLLLLTLLTAIAAVLVVQSLPEGDASAGGIPHHTKRVESITIDGRGLPLSRMRAALETAIGSDIDTQTLARDRAALEDVLASRGYLSGRVASPVVTYGPSGGVYVVFDVERGPLYHVRSITLAGPGWGDAGVVTLVPGDEALPDRLDYVRRTAEHTLANHGMDAAIELSVRHDAFAHLVDVTLTTSPR